MSEYTTQFMERVINRFISFPLMLKQAGLEGYRYGANFFCPFHENENTPSAKLYKDVDGDTLWCFSEHKKYKPCDVIHVGLVDITVYELFSRVWSMLTDEQREGMLAAEEQKRQETSIWDGYKDVLTLYRQGKVTLDQHIAALINIISISGRDSVVPTSLLER